jgi:hypothetical protein
VAHEGVADKAETSVRLGAVESKTASPLPSQPLRFFRAHDAPWIAIFVLRRPCVKPFSNINGDLFHVKHHSPSHTPLFFNPDSKFRMARANASSLLSLGKRKTACR